jgi:hypothetical protein
VIGNQHQRPWLDLLTDQDQLIKGLPDRQQLNSRIDAAQIERRDQYFELTTLVGQGADNHSSRLHDTHQQQALQYSRPQKAIQKKPLAGLTERILAL